MERSALQSVIDERRQQDAKWGEQNHDFGTWLAILMEEVGEASEAHLHTVFGGPKAGGMRREMVQVAAVALAIVECLDRQAWIATHGGPSALDASCPSDPGQKENGCQK